MLHFVMSYMTTRGENKKLTGPTVESRYMHAFSAVFPTNTFAREQFEFVHSFRNKRSSTRQWQEKAS